MTGHPISGRRAGKRDRRRMRVGVGRRPGRGRSVRLTAGRRPGREFPLDHRDQVRVLAQPHSTSAGIPSWRAASLTSGRSMCKAWVSPSSRV